MGIRHSILAVALALAGGGSAHAQPYDPRISRFPAAASSQWQTIEISSQPIHVSAGSVYSQPLPAASNVFKLLIQAESVGREGALFDVIVNGDVKGTIQTPAADPTHMVTVGDVASSVQFRSVSGSGFRLIRVLAVVRTTPPAAAPSRPFPDANVIAKLALDAVDAARDIDAFATPTESQAHVTPIKAAAGRLYAAAAGRGPYSERTRQAAVDLIALVDAARPFIDQQLARPGSFDCIVALLTLRARLDALIE